jgi:two-component system, OmpR family, alkaline phosphatase synthesis response regulator PhoP
MMRRISVRYFIIILSNEGFITEIAHSAEEALTHPLDDFDLLILDVMMGANVGFQACRKIKERIAY